MIERLYDILEQLILARYTKQKLPILESINSQLAILRYQTRLLFDFNLFSEHRYEYASKLIDEIGKELGGWINKQRQSQPSPPIPLSLAITYIGCRIF